MSELWPKLPRKVKGALCDFTVNQLEPMDMRVSVDDFGDYSSMHRKPDININKTLPEHHRWLTFWHELIHLLEEEAGIELKDEKNNSEVDRFALAMLSLWRRNDWALPGE